PHIIGLGGCEVGGINMCDTGIAALGLTDRPAHYFNAGVARLTGEAGDFSQGKVREDGGDEADVHEECVGLVGRASGKCGVRIAEFGVTDEVISVICTEYDVRSTQAQFALMRQNDASKLRPRYNSLDC